MFHNLRGGKRRKEGWGGGGGVKSIEENAARNGVRWGVGVKKEALCLLLREEGGGKGVGSILTQFPLFQVVAVGGRVRLGVSQHESFKEKERNGGKRAECCLCMSKDRTGEKSNLPLSQVFGKCF